MNQKDLKPAGTLAQKFGVKSICYGKAGVGKTPIAETAPRPVMLSVEPGLLSMRGSNIPTWEAYEPKRLDEFFSWFFQSNESKNYDTLVIDSLSQLAEIILKEELGRNKDGRKAYGELSRRTMTICESLYFLPNKHLYLICKQMNIDENGTIIKAPYFPGQDLNIKIPHLFDEILHLDEYTIPGVNGKQLAFRCKTSYDTKARDRSGNLNEFEPPHLGNLFAKCMK